MSDISFTQDDDDGWMPGYATPPDNTSPTSFSMEVMEESPSSPQSPSSPPSSPPESPVRRGLSFGAHDSFLKVTRMPQTPRSLLQHKSIRKENDRQYALPRRLLNDSNRPNTAPELGRSTMAPPKANVNPFTPKPESKSQKRPVSPSAEFGRGRQFRGRSNSIFGSPERDEEEPILKRPLGRRKREEDKNRLNINRYAEEFDQISELGSGEFGTVTKCRFRIDGTLYAIKRSKKPISGLAEEEQLLREVFAHAVISEQPHIVRYYSAWKEDNHMLIQNEYCDGGSLEDELKRRNGKPFSEEELARIYRHVAEGLACLHAKHLVHLDIKPGNIFIKAEEPGVFSPLSPPNSNNEKSTNFPFGVTSSMPGGSPMKGIEGVPEENEDAVSAAVVKIPSSSKDSEQTEDDCTSDDLLRKIFKIGDLGLVTSIDEPSVEEGDSRYLAKELLNDDYSYLTKADIFALGISIYELASGQNLPKNGEDWHKLRDGEAPHVKKYSANLNHLIELCIHPKPEMRPSAHEILKHPALVEGRMRAPQLKSKEQIWSELSASKMQNSQLLRQLAEEQKKSKLAKQFGITVSRRNSAPASRMRQRAGSMKW